MGVHAVLVYYPVRPIMRWQAPVLAVMTFVIGACTARDASATRLVGKYVSNEGKGGFVLYEDGTFVVVERGELDLELAVSGAKWRRGGNQVTLSCFEAKEPYNVRDIRYTVFEKDGKVMLELSKGEKLPTSFLDWPTGVPLSQSYQRTEPNQAADRMPGTNAP